MTHSDTSAEGGPLGNDHVSVSPSPGTLAADADYRSNKAMLEGYINATPLIWRGVVSAFWENLLTNTKRFSGRNMAQEFREMSANLGKKYGTQPTEMQTRCNNKLWTHNADGTVNGLKSDDLAPLFKAGKQADWPNLVLTSNHARAGETKDLSELMHGIEKIAGDAWGKPLDLHRFTEADRHKRSKPDVKNKTIIALACHTERDIFLNGAELIDRRCELEEDAAGNADPKKRSLRYMSPAAIRLAKLMMKLMVEPNPKNPKLVDLDRVIDRQQMDAPFIADDHQETLVLRADAASIAQHIKLVGYSKGANTVTDALRFLHLEYAALGKRLQMRGADKKLHPVTDKDMAMLMGNIGLLSIAPGEVPLTKGEKAAGIKRVTILNTHDLTAGHLVNPEAAQYDRWDDRLVSIEGTFAESGHSITHALGSGSRTGFIMNAANAMLKNYKTAQDEVRAFFASNHQKQAITTLCFSPESTENALYVQFASGISRADEALVEQHLLEALHAKGFANATIESDLTDRRRARIVLNHDAAKRPVATYTKSGAIVAVEKDMITRCKGAFAGFAALQNGHPFVTQDVFNYLGELEQSQPGKGVGDAQRAGNVGATPKGRHH